MSTSAPSWTKHTKSSAFSGIGSLEADVLAIVWEHDPQNVSVRDVYEQLLKERRIAYTTVMTVMDNLHKKGLLARDDAGIAFLYSAAIAGDEVAGNVLDDIVARLYRGRPQIALLRLLGLAGDLTDEQFAALRAQARALLEG
ncbi:MAG: BlaI/MecI/CopY family transcriptional regulator [Thermoleophilia bacterium]